MLVPFSVADPPDLLFPGLPVYDSSLMFLDPFLLFSLNLLINQFIHAPPPFFFLKIQ